MESLPLREPSLRASQVRLPPNVQHEVACPECQAPLARQSGCLVCLACGWARCG